MNCSAGMDQNPTGGAMDAENVCNNVIIIATIVGYG